MNPNHLKVKIGKQRQCRCKIIDSSLVKMMKAHNIAWIRMHASSMPLSTLWYVQIESNEAGKEMRAGGSHNPITSARMKRDKKSMLIRMKRIEQKQQEQPRFGAATSSSPL
jgi:hypothetical protein